MRSCAHVKGRSAVRVFQLYNSGETLLELILRILAGRMFFFINLVQAKFVKLLSWPKSGKPLPCAFTFQKLLNSLIQHTNPED